MRLRQGQLSLSSPEDSQKGWGDTLGQCPLLPHFQMSANSTAHSGSEKGAKGPGGTRSHPHWDEAEPERATNLLRAWGRRSLGQPGQRPPQSDLGNKAVHHQTALPGGARRRLIPTRREGWCCGHRPCAARFRPGLLGGVGPRTLEEALAGRPVIQTPWAWVCMCVHVCG